ncbi:RhuM family protein [Prevotella sp.]|uniref:RhuM family protein n=1 Tax=Prevotella sp. TaxID=59823 RepID=UPI003DA1F6EF
MSEYVVVAKCASTIRHDAIKEKIEVHDVDYYNLDVIISAGYRVKSKSWVEFRR